MQTDQNILIDILDLMKTTRDRTQCMSALDLLLNSTFTETGDIDKAIETSIPYWQKKAFLKLRENTMAEGKILPDGRQAFHQFLIDLKTTINSMPEVSITLAFEPTTEIIKNISSWFLLRTKKPVILDIRVNPKIIAGAAVGYMGKYKDFSVMKKLETTEKYAKL